MIKHVRTGLQTRPDFQSWDRSGVTALESRPHMFNSGSRLSFGCGPAALCNPWRFVFSPRCSLGHDIEVLDMQGRIGFYDHIAFQHMADFIDYE